jgi:Uma2 family endonuclease
VNGFTVVPDWVCEILTPASAGLDRDVKMPIYARHGVAYALLVDTRAGTLEAYARDAGVRREPGRYASDDQVALAPFDAVTIRLADLWVPA